MCRFFSEIVTGVGLATENSGGVADIVVDVEECCDCQMSMTRHSRHPCCSLLSVKPRLHDTTC